jgi:hypothetical protein
VAVGSAKPLPAQSASTDCPSATPFPPARRLLPWRRSPSPSVSGASLTSSARMGLQPTTVQAAGVDLRDVQIAARHADPRTTMRYDRARKNLDRHPNYVLAAYMASGT